jgi:chemotaxis methyl-accepting protein methylase
MRDSVFLRPVMGRCIGTTKFFRNEPFLKALVRILEKIPHPRVLYHGCSNGAEAYSLAIAWCETGDGKPIDIHATDIEPSFLDQGRLLTHERLTARAMRW